MSDTTTSTAPAGITHKTGTPCWIDSASLDVEASLHFYTSLFGWEASPVADPEAGGYSILTLDGAAVAAIGPLMEGQVATWSLYFATADADATAAKVEAAGGQVIAPPFDVLTSGRMAAFQDPTAAAFSVWQAKDMPGFAKAFGTNTFSWAELNTRGVDQVIDFYSGVFGWTAKQIEGVGAEPPYVEWQLDDQNVGGAIDLADIPGMSGEVPPHWLVYFAVNGLDAAVTLVLELGGVVFREPVAYPGGRLAIVGDPLGPVFGLMEPSAEG